MVAGFAPREAVVASRPVSAPSEATTPRSSVTAEATAIPTTYSNYVLFVLFVVYVFNFVDRQILSILIDPIKADLGASDTQMGFLTGFAFAVFYTVAGIPDRALGRPWRASQPDRDRPHGVERDDRALGRGAELSVPGAGAHRRRRRRGGGQPARAFAHLGLLHARAARHRDLDLQLGHPRRRHAGLPAGGWINEFFSWRVAFLVVGVPGILFALVVRFTVQGAAARQVGPASPARRSRHRARQRQGRAALHAVDAVVRDALGRDRDRRLLGLRLRVVGAVLPAAGARDGKRRDRHLDRHRGRRRRRARLDPGRPARRSSWARATSAGTCGCRRCRWSPTSRSSTCSC